MTEETKQRINIREINKTSNTQDRMKTVPKKKPMYKKPMPIHHTHSKGLKKRLPGHNFYSKYYWNSQLEQMGKEKETKVIQI